MAHAASLQHYFYGEHGILELQTETTNLGSLAVQVSCGSFAAFMVGATSVAAAPIDSLEITVVGSTVTPGGSVSIDLNDDGTNDFNVVASLLLDDILKPSAVGAPIEKIVLPESGIGRVLPLKSVDQLNLTSSDFLSVGDEVGPGTLLSQSSTSIFPSELGTTYIGLALAGSNFFPTSTRAVGPDEFLFGWAEFSTSGTSSLTLERYAIQTVSGEVAPIVASTPSPVPLPASLPLLALGIGGIAALRRQRKLAA